MLRSETVAIHAGRAARIAGEPLNPPLVTASSFYGSGYAREQGSPGWAPFEAAVGALEGGVTIAFASGMAAISAVLETLPAGAKVVGPEAGYASVWAWDHFMGRGDVTVPAVEGPTILAMAAGATRNVTVGTFVANVMNRASGLRPSCFARSLLMSRIAAAPSE